MKDNDNMLFCIYFGPLLNIVYQNRVMAGNERRQRWAMTSSRGTRLKQTLVILFGTSNQEAP